MTLTKPETRSLIEARRTRHCRVCNAVTRFVYRFEASFNGRVFIVSIRACSEFHSLAIAQLKADEIEARIISLGLREIGRAA